MKNSSRILSLVIVVILYAFQVQANDNLEKVSIQLDWVFQYQYAGLIAAKEMGYYAEAGLDVELKEYTPGVDTIGDVMSQNTNYGINNASIVVNSKGEVVPVVLLATYMQRSPLVFATAPNIKGPRDFIGKRIMGTTDELRYSSLALLLAHFDISRDNADFVEHTFTIDDFAEKRVDIMSVFRSNQLYEMDKRKIEYNIIDPADYGFYMSAVNMFSSSKEALSYPERTQKFIEATNRGWAYSLDHPSEIIDLIYDKYSQEKSKDALFFEANITKDMMLHELYPIGQTNEELSLRALKQLQQTKLLEKNVSLGTFLFKDLIYKNSSNISLTDAEQAFLATHPVIKVANETDWVPFDFNESGVAKGLGIDFIKLLAQKVGIEIEFIHGYTWTELVGLFKQGEIDVMPVFYLTEERKDFTLYTEPYYKGKIGIFTNSDRDTFNLNLAGKKVGMETSDGAIPLVKMKTPGIVIIEIDGKAELVKKLETKQLDAIIGNPLVFYSLAKDNQLQKIQLSNFINMNEEEQEKISLYLGVRKELPILHSILQKAMQNVSDNEMAKIEKEWTDITIVRPVNWVPIFQIFGVIIVIVFFLLWHNRKLKSIVNKKIHELKIVNDGLESTVNKRTRELTKVNKKLNKSLEEVKTIRGIIPICMHCKEIRDDKGSWNQLEKYISEHSDAQFSHGICGKCLEKHYPEVAD